jgi:predicted signal transduction protein with EAL and GGDEF domain
MTVMTTDDAHLDEVDHLPDVYSLTGFGNRDRLFADLDEAVAELSASKLMVIFELGGLKQHARAFGATATNSLLTCLANRLAETVGTSGSCYSLRGAEFCTLVDDPGSERSALLETVAAALCENDGGHEVSAAFGAVLLPGEAEDTARALELADQRLNFQKRARGFDRPRYNTAVA